MSLAPGEKLGPYEILSLCGKGGMGEVYKAHDTRLQRDVAIKTSAKQFSERFEREARAIAALNHPNICTIYDVGSLPNAPGYLVMEYVEGAPLKGPYPLDTALNYARQIGSALEAAHDKAITHRDLKPGNIMLKPDGVIKVLDFGLAKFGGPTPSSISQDSPTLSMAATVAGTILGTAAYMAPEQARGKEVDKRADIWAFGVVFHEMLTGERLFKGEDLTETMAAVVMREPDLSTIPHQVRRLLKKCLQKDPAKRLRDIGDVWELLDEPAVPPPSRDREGADRRSKLPWLIGAAAIVAGLATAGLSFTRTPQAVSADPVRFTLNPSKGTTLTSGGPNRSTTAVSPDGRYIAFLADETDGTGAGTRSLWVRELKSLSAQKLDKTEGAIEPFWSPDSKHIGFGTDGKLKRISVSGGAPINVCDSTNFEGGTWFQPPGADSEGLILFATTNGIGIQRVPASGGVPTAVTKLAQGEEGHSHPQFLPDGKRFQYFVRGGPKPGIYVQSFGSDQRTFLLTTHGRASMAPPDYLLYMRDNTLLSQHVDWEAVKVLGEPVAVTDEVRSGGSNGRNGFSVSSTGTLVYRGGSTNEQQFRWYTRDGKADGPPVARLDANAIELSPDNKRGIIERRTTGGTTLDLWLVDLPGGVLSRLTSDAGAEYDAVWSPDSRRIAFQKESKPGVYQMLIGSGRDSLVYSGVVNDVFAWTREGLLVRIDGKVSLLPVPEETAASPVAEKPKVVFEVKYPVNEFQVSPDGKWVAYYSAESGSSEVWVASFPGFTDRRKVSAGFGEAPRWRADGKELFFLPSGTGISAVDVKTGATFESGTPKLLFTIPGAATLANVNFRYAVSNDGKRFLVRQQPETGENQAEPIYVILNWPALGK